MEHGVYITVLCIVRKWPQNLTGLSRLLCLYL